MFKTLSTIILLNGTLAGTAPNSTVVGGLSRDAIRATGTLTEARLAGADNDDQIDVNLQGSSTTISGGTTINGNDGFDSITISNSILGSNARITSSSIWGGLENDTIIIGNDTTAAIALNEGTAVEGNQGNDSISIRGSYNRAFINGNEDNDTIQINSTNVATGSGNIVETTVLGGTGNDSIDLNLIAPANATGLFLNGEAGNDTVRIINGGGINASTIRGGTGNDFIEDPTPAGVRYSINQVFINANEGDDRIQLNNINNSTASTIRGGQGDDNVTLIFNGNVATTLINGNQGNDNITATFNGATVSATTVFGGVGDDTIIVNDGGANGRIVVTGNEGADRLTGFAGGSGNNKVTEFAYSYGDTAINQTGVGRDTITNIAVDDVISLSSDPIIAINLLTPATATLAGFIESASTLDANTVGLWNEGGVRSYLFISNGGGLDSGDILIQLDGTGGTLTAANFIVDANTLTFA